MCRGLGRPVEEASGMSLLRMPSCHVWLECISFLSSHRPAGVNHFPSWKMWLACPTYGSGWTRQPSLKPPQRALHFTWTKGSIAVAEWLSLGERLSFQSVSHTVSLQFSSSWSSRAENWTLSRRKCGLRSATIGNDTATKRQAAPLSFQKTEVHHLSLFWDLPFRSASLRSPSSLPKREPQVPGIVRPASPSRGD